MLKTSEKQKTEKKIACKLRVDFVDKISDRDPNLTRKATLVKLNIDCRDTGHPHPWPALKSA